MSGDTYPGANEILWADVGTELGLDKTGLRNLRTTFGDVLGLDTSRFVPRAVVPVLQRIQHMRREGVSDSEIRESIARLPRGREWPEEVLSRMEAAASATMRVALPLAPDALLAGTVSLGQATAGSAAAEISHPQPSGRAAEVSPTDGLSIEAPYGTAFEHEAPPALDAQRSLPDLSEATLREIVFDLRREITTQAISERELTLHLMQQLRKLTLEVRDLRYAFLLASSRKDRKKGIKAISRLLSG